jgi:hypothetical protein
MIGSGQTYCEQQCLLAIVLQCFLVADSMVTDTSQVLWIDVPVVRSEM